MPRVGVVCGVAGVVLAGVLAGAPAASAGPGDLVVRFAADASNRDRAQARADADVRRERTLPVPGMELVDPDRGVSVRQAAAELAGTPDVLYVEADRPRQMTKAADDPLFSYQWSLEWAGATSAWDQTTGSADVLVAVADSGAELDHPDLAGNLVSGWDFVEDDDAPQDEDGHGTHVTGTIAARGGDRYGVAGVAWNAQVMPLRVLDANGDGFVSDAVGAYAYAARAGVRVVNLSLGGEGFSRAEHDALAAAEDVLFVAAAGNEGADNDQVPIFPCAYELENVLCVTASGREDTRPDFANLGARSVDLAAPGVRIASTGLHRTWRYMDGTSMAAPHVTGAAALMLSEAPAARPQDLIDALKASADPAAAFTGVTVTGGRLDIAEAVRIVRATPKPTPVPPTVAHPPAAPVAHPPAPQAPYVPPAAGQPPLTPVAPVTPARPARMSAKLRGSARVKAGRLRVQVRTVRAAAGGRVRVFFRLRGRTIRSARTVSRGGRVTVTRKLSRKMRRRGKARVTVRFYGNARVLPSTARTTLRIR